MQEYRGEKARNVVTKRATRSRVGARRDYVVVVVVIVVVMKRERRWPVQDRMEGMGKPERQRPSDRSSGGAGTSGESEAASNNGGRVSVRNRGRPKVYVRRQQIPQYRRGCSEMGSYRLLRVVVVPGCGKEGG